MNCKQTHQWALGTQAKNNDVYTKNTPTQKSQNQIIQMLKNCGNATSVFTDIHGHAVLTRGGLDDKIAPRVDSKT